MTPGAEIKNGKLIVDLSAYDWDKPHWLSEKTKIIPPPVVQRLASKALRTWTGSAAARPVVESLASGHSADGSILRTMVKIMTPLQKTKGQEWMGLGGLAGFNWARKQLESVSKLDTPEGVPMSTVQELNKRADVLLHQGLNKRADALLAKFNPNHDEKGQFSSGDGGGGGAGGRTNGTVLEVPLRPRGESAPHSPEMKWALNHGFTPSHENLSPAQREVETRFAEQIAADPEKAMAEYFAQHPGKENFLSADDAMELSPDYVANRGEMAGAAHEGGSWLTKMMFAKMLSEPPSAKFPFNTVFFTAGGSGAGKTSAIVEGSSELAEIYNKAQIVYDGTFSNLNSSDGKIQQALAAGKDVTVAHTQREPVDALVAGMLKRAERTQRTVPIASFADSHSKVFGTVTTLAEKYKNDPRVTFIGVDNTHGQHNSIVMPLKSLPKVDTGPGLKDRLIKVTLGEYNAGRISAATYRGVIGQDPPASQRAANN